MNSIMRGAAHWQSFASALFAGVIALSAGCDYDRANKVDEETGTLDLALTGVSPSGSIYRLRNGDFTIVGEETGFSAEVSTEMDPYSSSIDLEVPSDYYSIYLNPGYYLELVSEAEPLAMSARAAKENPELQRRLRVSGARDSGGAAAPVDVGSGGAPSVYPGDAGSPGVPATGGVIGIAGFPGTGASAGIPGYVDSVLISENPAYEYVEPFENSVVVFRFRVGDDIIVTDPGTLSIQIAVEESSTCEEDEFEPNNTMEEATMVAADEPFSATACQMDDDWYVFEAPVAEGELFGVNVDFVHAAGDIDAILVNSEGDIVAFGTGVEDGEMLAAVNDGEPYYLLVYTYTTSNTYSVQILDDVAGGLSNCCTDSPLPTCTDPAVSDCVCEMDPFCCEVAFDAICVMESIGECGAECLGSGNCCEVTEGPGCSIPEVNQCVCTTDPSCCMSSYDELCITEAIAECGLTCEVPDPTNDCCSVSGTPGCDDVEALECVCGVDPSCCTGAYDANCVNIATTACGQSCAAPEPSADCCSVSGAPGCGDSAIEACVCSVDSFCCDTEFDALCVQIAAESCGAACEEGEL